MKNKIKAIFKTLVQDILKPFIVYTLLFGSVFERVIECHNTMD